MSNTGISQFDQFAQFYQQKLFTSRITFMWISELCQTFLTVCFIGISQFGQFEQFYLRNPNKAYNLQKMIITVCWISELCQTLEKVSLMSLHSFFNKYFTQAELSGCWNSKSCLRYCFQRNKPVWLVFKFSQFYLHRLFTGKNGCHGL